MTSDEEIPVLGGNVTAGLVRVGHTVRRPAGPWTPAVHALLEHLYDVGFEGAPRSLGLDERGRHVLEWVDGRVTHPYRPAADSPALAEVGRLARRFHDAASGFTPPADATWGTAIAPDGHDLVVHHDLASWNFVHGEGRAVFIDWDAAGPGTRLWDLAWTAWGFTDLDPARLRALVDGYDLDEAARLALADLLPVRYRAMADLLRTGGQPWARLAAEGHRDEWERITGRAEAAVPTLRAALVA